MNFGKDKQHILTSKQKYLFCVQVQKEPVSVIVVSWVFKLSPLEGLALRALGLRWQTETKAMDVDEWCLFLWTRVWPRRLSYTNRHGLSVVMEGRKKEEALQKMNTS